MLMKSVATVAMFSAFLGCTGPSQPGSPSGAIVPGVQVQPGRQFDLAIGQEARIQGTSITVRFSSVGEDSRCPIDVQCVWAGNAVVRLILNATGASSVEAALNTTLEPKQVVYEGRTVRLIGLKPAPRSGTQIPSADYVATFEIVN